MVALHRLGDIPELGIPYRRLGPWMSTAEPDVVLIAVARLAALGLAWWLLGSTALYALAQLLRRNALAATIGVLTLPSARRILDQWIAGALLATALVTRTPVASAGPVTSEPASAEPRSGRLDPGAPHPAEVRIGRTSPTAEPSTTTTTTSAPPAPVPGPAPDPIAPEPPAYPEAPGERTSAVAGTYVVGAGDNLWLIAARQVAGIDRPVAEVPAAEIVHYWHALIARNGPHLRSGDPNLIFPGEVIVLVQVGS